MYDFNPIVFRKAASLKLSFYKNKERTMTEKTGTDQTGLKEGFGVEAGAAEQVEAPAVVVEVKIIPGVVSGVRSVPPDDEGLVYA